ncbi:MAG: phage tail assembly chaperone [Pseudomonadota bacterium]
MSPDEGLNWSFMMRFAFGVLHLSPDQFWAMTPREFDAALKGHLGQFTDSGPMRATDLAALAARFPDGASFQ